MLCLLSYRDKDVSEKYCFTRIQQVPGTITADLQYIQCFSHTLFVCMCVCDRQTVLNTPHLSFCACYCCSCPEEESGYYIAVDVLVQHDAHVSVCVLLFPVCRAGFYKSTHGNMECSKCPPHSFSHHEGSLHCGCEKNYFRAEGDPASMACTRKCVFRLFLA